MIFFLLILLSLPVALAQSINPGDEIESCNDGKVELRFGTSRDRSGQPKNQTLSEVRVNGNLANSCKLTYQAGIDQRKFTAVGGRLTDDSHFFGARAGVGTFHLLKRGFLVAGASANYRVETESGVSQVLPVGYVIAGRKSSDRITWLYGIAYSDPLGQAQPIPIIGAVLLWNERWSTRFILPLSITTTWNQSPYRRLRLIASAMGYQARLENRGRFDSDQAELRGRFRAFKISVAYDVGISESSDFVIELGILAARKYEVLNGKDSLYVQKLHPASYAQIGFIKHF